MLEHCQKKFETIMIIDDNSIDLYISSRIITKNDFANTVLPYISAKLPLTYLKKHKNTPKLLPNLIFVDIYMPEMSGFEFIASYNELSLELKNKCSLYVISSTNNEKDIDQIYADNNIVAFHEKPITKAFLEGLA
ncbi:response regulator [Flavobacterium sp. 25HG05S-40]|uniref:response regulator n=1 Tax=Flavobacterium sp. 25HG05S-40 TaxID=3458682 RepID=UPI0040448FF4